MTAKSILQIVPGLQATSLVAMNIPKFSMKPTKKLRVKPKRIVRKGVGTIIGIGLIKPTSEMINLL